jgi:hypothetical protein
MKYLKIKGIVLLAFCTLSVLANSPRTRIIHPAVPLTSQSPFGVNSHLQSGIENTQMPQNLEMMYQAGIRLVRCDIAWGGVEYPKGTWHYENIDNLLNQLENQGLGVLGILDYNVTWADPAYRHLDDWLRYVEKTVNRYKCRVRYWEVWNEPDYQWDVPNGANNAAQYAALLTATYNKIKEIDPDITVLFTGYGNEATWLTSVEKTFQAGASTSFDKICIHPYRPLMDNMTKTTAFLNDINSLRNLMTTYSVGDKGIWISEMGLSSFNQAAYNPGATEAIRETNQANFLQQTMLLSLRFGIEKYFLYEFRSSDSSSEIEGNARDRERYFGLVHNNLDKKPAYFAYSNLTSLYPTGSVVDTSIAWNQGNFCVVGWTQPGGTRVWAVWAPDTSRTATVTIGAGLQSAVDSSGTPVEVAQNATSLVVGPGVIFLIGPASFTVQ